MNGDSRPVFFDFDGTLTTRDTILPLGLFIARNLPGKYLKIAQLVVFLAMLKLRIISNHGFKERFCSLLLKDQSAETVARTSEEFIRDYLKRISKKTMVEKLVRHVQNGDEVYVVSSNFGFFLSELKTIWPVSGVVATEAECINGRYTGRVVGLTCDGEEKLARVTQLLGESKVRSAIAYGDSVGDRSLLDFVSCSNWVS